MSTISSAYMNLPVPVVGVEPGPTWATDINNCLTIIDQHNHTTGQGVQVTPAGLNINTDLSVQANNLTVARSVRLDPQGAPLSEGTDLGCLYESGVDLYYNDGNGNQIRLTQSGSIVGTTGSITGLVAPASATYVSATQTFIWQSDTNTAANLDAGSVILRNLTANSFGLTLSPPTLSVDYAIQLPVLPVSELPLVINSSGVMSARQLVNADLNPSITINRSQISPAFQTPTVQRLTSTGTTTGYKFTVSSANATVGATYTNNAATFTVLATISGATTLFTSVPSGSPLSSGTLTKASGTGDSSITFSAAQATATYTTPANVTYLRVRMAGGGGGGGGGSGASNGTNGGAGGVSVFGTNLLIASGGAGGGHDTTAPGTGGSATVNSPAIQVIAITGSSGSGGNSSSSGGSCGGTGGSSPLSGAGGGQPFNQSGFSPNALANTGSGGGGGAPTTGTNSGGGSGGGAGGYIEALLAGPSSTYIYSVATAGSAGGGGTSGLNGGTGGTGVIFVEEYYQ